MRLRIRNSFKNRGAASLEEKANILAYNIWQISLAGAKNLHQEDYHYDNDQQRVDVIREYLLFLVHVADRMVFDTFDAQEREQFIKQMAQDTAHHIQRNTEHIMGAGDYRGEYFAIMNTRFADYSRGSFADGMPGYSLFRMFGEKVCDIMGNDQTNKWTIDQIMEIDGPMMVEKMAASLSSIIDQPSDDEKKKTSVELLLDEG